MTLTRAQALEYHRWMWRDMQKDLGNRPSWEERMIYKHEWCKMYFPQEHIMANCFLCEYALRTREKCKSCPIDWGGCGMCSQDSFDAEDGIDWRMSAISEILALPEKEENRC